MAQVLMGGSIEIETIQNRRRISKGQNPGCPKAANTVRAVAPIKYSGKISPCNGSYWAANSGFFIVFPRLHAVKFLLLDLRNFFSSMQTSGSAKPMPNIEGGFINDLAIGSEFTVASMNSQPGKNAQHMTKFLQRLATQEKFEKFAQVNQPCRCRTSIL